MFTFCIDIVNFYETDLMLNGVVTTRVLCIIPMLPVLCICGDMCVQHCISRWTRALCDSSVHASVASLAWLAVSADQLTLLTFIQAGLCGFLSTAVDLDHFVAAGSLSLEVSQDHISYCV